MVIRSVRRGGGEGGSRDGRKEEFLDMREKRRNDIRRDGNDAAIGGEKCG